MIEIGNLYNVCDDSKTAYAKINEYLKNSETVGLLTHVNMDADAFGSALALCLYLKSMGKKATIYGQKEISHFLEFFEPYDFYDYITKDAKVDTVIAVDCGNLGRFTDRSEIFEKADNKIVIDHHMSESDINADVAVVEPDAAATAVLVWEFFRANEIEITYEIALNLYYALSRDTGGFRHGNTDPRAFICAADLLSAGLDVALMTNNLFYTKSFQEQKLRGIGLDKLQLYFGGKVALCCIEQSDYDKSGACEADAETVVDSGREILGVDISIVLRESAKGDVRVNFRSKEFNVRQIAEHFNGGGHEHAAGCSINDDIHVAAQKIIDYLADCGGFEA